MAPTYLSLWPHWTSVAGIQARLAFLPLVALIPLVSLRPLSTDIPVATVRTVRGGIGTWRAGVTCGQMVVDEKMGWK